MSFVYGFSVVCVFAYVCDVTTPVASVSSGRKQLNRLVQGCFLKPSYLSRYALSRDLHRNICGSITDFRWTSSASCCTKRTRKWYETGQHIERERKIFNTSTCTLCITSEKHVWLYWILPFLGLVDYNCRRDFSVFDKSGGTFLNFTSVCWYWVNIQNSNQGTIKIF